MRKLLSAVILLCFLFYLVSCGTKEPEVIREEFSSSGVSDGAFSFIEGSVKFTVPSGIHYTFTQGAITSDNLIGVSVCYLGKQNSGFIPVATESVIGTQSIDQLEKAGIKDALAFKQDNLLDKYADFTQLDDLYMGIAGKDLTFQTFKENETTPEVIAVACFSDSMYIYTIETTINELSEDYYTPFIEMLVGSEYVGNEELTEFNQ